MSARFSHVPDQNATSLPVLLVRGDIVIEGLGLVVVELWSKEIIYC